MREKHWSVSHMHFNQALLARAVMLILNVTFVVCNYRFVSRSILGKFAYSKSQYNRTLYFFLKRFYLFIFREGEGKEKERERNSMCGCLLHTPYWGHGPQPRHVPRLGTEPATFWFAGPCSIHWATAARARLFHKLYLIQTWNFSDLSILIISLNCW